MICFRIELMRHVADKRTMRQKKNVSLTRQRHGWTRNAIAEVICIPTRLAVPLAPGKKWRINRLRFDSNSTLPH